MTVLSVIKQKSRSIMRYFVQYSKRRNSCAKIEATAILSPESSIENIFGDPSHIYIGGHSYLRGRLITYGHGGNISIGDWCYIGLRTEIWSMDSIKIGNRVLIAHDVNIHDGTAHSLNPKDRHTHYRRIMEGGHPRKIAELPGIYSAPIIIEDDVWISFGVTILKGVHIGKGSVIAANALVTQDVPSNTLYRCEIQPSFVPLDSVENSH